MARLWTVVSVLTLTLHQILAQSILDILQCAGKDAISSVTSTSCPPADIVCLCKDRSLIDKLIPIVKHKCDSEDFQKLVDLTQGSCDKAGVTITVPISAPTRLTSTSTVVLNPTPTVPISAPTGLPPTPTTNSTAKPRVIPTFTIFSKNATRTDSVAPFRNSTSGKPTAPPSTTVKPTPKPPTFTGAANRNSAAYIWAVIFLGTTVLLI